MRRSVMAEDPTTRGTSVSAISDSGVRVANLSVPVQTAQFDRYGQP